MYVLRNMAAVRHRASDCKTRSLSESSRNILYLQCPLRLRGLCPQLTNLRAVQVMGAGVDSVINDPAISRQLQLFRIADPLMGQRMATWVQREKGFQALKRQVAVL